MWNSQLSNTIIHEGLNMAKTHSTLVDHFKTKQKIYNKKYKVKCNYITINKNK